MSLYRHVPLFEDEDGKKSILTMIKNGYSAENVAKYYGLTYWETLEHIRWVENIQGIIYTKSEPDNEKISIHKITINDKTVQLFDMNDNLIDNQYEENIDMHSEIDKVVKQLLDRNNLIQVISPYRN